MLDALIRWLVNLLPFALAFTTISAYTLYTGEAMPLRMVVNWQMHELETVYRPRYGNRDLQFKTLAINMRRPEVLAIGSSRILQFRAGFFNLQPEVFYNAAAPAWRLEQVAQVLYNLEADALPRVIMLALDAPWFNEAYRGDVFPPPRSDFEQLVFANRALLEDIHNRVPLTRSGFRLAQYGQRRVPNTQSLALGMRAIRDGHGFRSDGSELYGDFLVAGWLHMPNMRDLHMRLMREGRDMYVYGDQVNRAMLTQLAHLLAWAVDHEITVVGFLPAYMPSLWQQMQTRGQHSYMNALTPELERLFIAYQFPFFDFSDGRTTQTADWEFFDGWHASELGNLRLYIHLASALPEVFTPYSDVERLRVLAHSSGSTWDVFGLDGLR